MRWIELRPFLRILLYIRKQTSKRAYTHLYLVSYQAVIGKKIIDGIDVVLQLLTFIIACVWWKWPLVLSMKMSEWLPHELRWLVVNSKKRRFHQFLYRLQVLIHFFYIFISLLLHPLHMLVPQDLNIVDFLGYSLFLLYHLGDLVILELQHVFDALNGLVLYTYLLA